MRLSSAKDKVLKHIVTSKEYYDFNCFRIKHDLKIEHYLVITALLEFQKDGFVTLINNSTIGSGRMKTYSIQTVDAPAYEFYNSGRKFRYISFWKVVKEVLKSYYVIIALLITSFISVYQTCSNKDNQANLQSLHKQLQLVTDSLHSLKSNK